MKYFSKNDKYDKSVYATTRYQLYTNLISRYVSVTKRIYFYVTCITFSYF